MKVVSKAKYLRMSPKKVRMVLKEIAGKNALKAEQELDLINKAAVRPIRKVLKAAIANAENNFNLKKDTLVITLATADEGPKLKRFHARARGTGNPIMKRTSHITIALEGADFLSKTKAKPAAVPTTKVKDITAAEQLLEGNETAVTTKPEAQAADAVETKGPDISKKIFRRKVG